MLVISRRVGERVKIGPNIWVMVTRTDGDTARLAITAPRHLTIVREELLAKKEAAK
jgi:carbon storage regulator CsrA